MSQTLDIEKILLDSRAQVLAVLQNKLKHLHLVEDCYQEACIRAIINWKEAGIPSSPIAWLITVSKNIAIDILRKEQKYLTQEFSEEGMSANPLAENDLHSSLIGIESEFDKHGYKDDVLRLFFCCCHPELGVQDQIALALKIIGGFSTAAIAKALLTKEKAMEQRITRAKNKAYLTADDFESPSRKERLQRLSTVMNLIYLIFNEGYSKTGGEQHLDINLCQEAIRLGYLLNDLFADVELHGLLALLFFQHSRCDSRLDDEGNLLTLEQQDRSLWQGVLIAKGNELLRMANKLRTTYSTTGAVLKTKGVYELQALIAAEHSNASKAENTRWDNILSFYDVLFEVKPSAVVALNRSVAVAKVYGVNEALLQLDQIEAHLQQYLYFHTTRAGLFEQAQRTSDARNAYLTALTLQPTSAEKKYIEEQLKQLGSL